MFKSTPFFDLFQDNSLYAYKVQRHWYAHRIDLGYQIPGFRTPEWKISRRQAST